MASFVYDNAKAAFLKAEIDLDLPQDIRVALLMTNTTADTEKDKTTLSGFTTLDDHDGSGYARKALANEAVATDNPNNRGEFDADDLTWTSLGAGTRDIQGALVYKHITDDTDSVPIAWIDSGGFPATVSGGDFTITWNAEGILQAT